MSLKEGRCVNCGSILFLDEKAPKGHCLYCDAVFDNREAFLCATDSSERTYPNEPQPHYDGPNLDPPAVKKSAVMPKIAPSSKSTSEKTVKPVFVSRTKSVPHVKMTRKAVFSLSAGAAAVLIAIIAIMLPLIIKRNLERADIVANFNAKNGTKLEAGKTLVIQNQSNNNVIVVLPENTTKEKVAQLVLNYCEVRSEVKGIGKDDWSGKYGAITMHIATNKGGYLATFDQATTTNSGLILRETP